MLLRDARKMARLLPLKMQALLDRMNTTPKRSR